jgi:hypothetical protein
MTKISELPKELLDKIKAAFDAEPRVQQLRVQQGMMIRTGKYREALEMAQQIDALFNQVVYEYLKENERQVEQVDVANIDMPLGDKEDMMKLLLVCFMCADIIESSVIDMDDILHRYDNNMYMEMFDDIKQVMSMSKEKLKYLQENSGYLKDLVWGEKCDNMYLLMRNKAKSIMNKRKNDPNWGKNTEKFNKQKSIL